jgi:ADP-ribose pyrophosphatase YjhB (NUDIX family)
LEETGIEVEPVRLIAVVDAMRLGFSSIPFYSLVFHCRMTGGELRAHPLESLSVGWFGRDEMPTPLRQAGDWVGIAFAAIDGQELPTRFDLPRAPPWRAAPNS